ncbi:MAG TPA: hypothetical protein DF613_05370 [Lachnospiraceae bacterium]|nr:hypothetical protein [Lachnospiraceae bacterium]
MKKTKTLCLGLLAFFLLACLTFATPVKAGAATFNQCGRETKIGNYYIWSDSSTNSIRISKSKSGNGSPLVQASDGRYTAGCISDGSTVYYAERELTKGGAFVYNSYIYKIKVDGKDKSKIGYIKNISSPAAYYKGYLYLECYDKNDPLCIHTYRMDVKKGTSKRVIKNARVVDQNGRYLLAMPNTGAVMPLKLYVYDCKTGKSTRLTTKAGSACFSGKKIYYSEYTSGEYSSSSTFRIRSCSLAGKSKKTIVKKLQGSSTGRITSKSVYYIVSDSRGNTKYYRYDFKSGKAVKISWEKYKG